MIPAEPEILPRGHNDLSPRPDIRQAVWDRRAGRRALRRIAIGVLFLLTVPGLASRSGAQATPDGKTAESPPPEPGIQKLESPAIENLFRLSPRLYSGGQPAGEAGFAALESLGVRTILSVDGTPPEVELARKHGLRYVHLPIGYDGLRQEKLATMIKAVRELPGPVFIHCHHGKHRGPAAAAVCALATEDWSRTTALAWLKQAGTDPEYRGLYRDVRELKIPSRDETGSLTVEFPESVPAPSLVESMLEIDRVHDRLKQLARSDWKVPADQRMAPAELALQLVEGYRELSRNAETEQRGAGYADQLKSAEQQADALRDALEQLARTPAEPLALKTATLRLEGVGKSCKSCHRQFRDGR